MREMIRSALRKTERSIFKKELETAVIAPDIDNDGNKIEQKEVVEEDEIIDDSEFDFDSMYEDYEILFEDED